jgi:Mg2+/Co2+ transporter CorB
VASTILAPELNYTMNIIHVRDTMKLLRDKERISSKMLHAALNGPIFIYDLAAMDWSGWQDLQGAQSGAG